MTPAQIKLAGVAIALAVAFGAGWAVNGWRLSSEVADLEVEHSKAVATAANARSDEVVRLTGERDRLQGVLGTLDAAGLEKIKGEANETERLRTCVAAGTCGLRVRAVCPAAPAGVPGAPQSSSVDSGAGARLDGPAESAYFTLRGGILSAQNKLATCQASLGCLTGQRPCPTNPAE